MKLTLKIFLIVIPISALAFCAAVIYFSLYGKDLITRGLENAAQRKARIGYFALRFPLEIILEDVEIPGLVKAARVNIRPDLSSFFSGRLVINNLILSHPEFTYVKAKPAVITALAGTPDPAPGTPIPTPGAAPAAPNPLLAALNNLQRNNAFGRRLFIRQISASGGTINFIDQGAANGGLSLRLDELSFSLRNLSFLPRPERVNFNLKAKVPWYEGQDNGSIESSGWFDLYQKDIDLAVSIKDIDGIYLYPYYSAWVNLEKARIVSAKLDFNSSIRGQENKITAACHLELKDIVFKPHSPQEELKKEERVASAMLGAFKTMDQGMIAVDFTIHTNMDKFEFSFADLKSAVVDKMARVKAANRITAQKAVLFPGKIFGGTLKGAGDLSKALLGGTFSLGKELKKAIEVAFKKER